MNSYSGAAGFGWMATGLLVGIPVGALVYGWWRRQVARERRRIPKRWPLNPRVVANSDERKVWRWLSSAFFEHSVMIKMPVTRFTLPKTREEGLHWYELLSGVNCTFTLVNPRGQVLGCVDVTQGVLRSRRNHMLKQTLLKQCGIAYVVVESNRLPSLADIRSEFLGEMASMAREQERDEIAIRAASTSLRASLMHQRKTRNSDHAPLTSGRADSDETSSRMDLQSRLPSQWSDNSFIMPLDSRKADLH